MASVINRETKEFLISVNTPNYPVEYWIHNPDMSNVEGVPVKYWKIVGDNVLEMDSFEKDTVDASNLDSYKDERASAIDARTDELISQGFEYATKVFSLSQNAQAQLMGINQVRNDEYVTYPIRWSTLDNKDAISISSADEVRVFYLTALATYRSYLDSGNTLKDSIRAAINKSEVDAVIDER